jgi:hypothetical protein
LRAGKESQEKIQPKVGFQKKHLLHRLHHPRRLKMMLLHLQDYREELFGSLHQRSFKIKPSLCVVCFCMYQTPILIPLLCYTVFGDPKVSISMTAIYAVGRVPIRINFSNHVLLLDFTSSSMRWKLRILSLYILDYVLFSSGYTLPRPFQMSLISKYLSCQDSHHPQISYLFQNIV